MIAIFIYNKKAGKFSPPGEQENGFNVPNAKGYSWNKTMQKYESSIRTDGVKKHLGYFAKEEDARQVYLVAKEKYHIIEKR